MQPYTGYFVGRIKVALCLSFYYTVAAQEVLSTERVQGGSPGEERALETSQHAQHPWTAC